MTLPANRRLEDLFDMSHDTDIDDGARDSDPAEAGNDIQTNLPVLPETLVALDKIESALPLVRGLEASDQEMDELATRASQHFEDLMSLGMQVDSRYASEIFAVASTMLGHAITAKTAKMNKKLRMIDLQLKKARLDQTDGARTPPDTGHGRVLNRNDLLRTLLQRDIEKPQADK
jgi:hypothetical protein